MREDDAVRHYVTTIAMADMDFVQEHIYQIGRLVRDNRLPLNPREPDVLEREILHPAQYCKTKEERFDHMQRNLSPKYYKEVFTLYQKWDRVGRRAQEKMCEEFLELERQWKECWKLEKEASQ
jgi:hypothetical protein